MQVHVSEVKSRALPPFQTEFSLSSQCVCVCVCVYCVLCVCVCVYCVLCVCVYACIEPGGYNITARPCAGLITDQVNQAPGEAD